MFEAQGSRFPDNDQEAGKRLIVLDFAIEKVSTFLSNPEQITWDSIAHAAGWYEDKDLAEKTLDAEFVFYLDHNEISSSSFAYQLSLKTPHSHEVLLKVFAVAKQFLYKGGWDGGSLSSEVHPFSDS